MTLTTFVIGEVGRGFQSQNEFCDQATTQEAVRAVDLVALRAGVDLAP